MSRLEAMDKPLVIGSRGSRLALWQTEHVAEMLRGLTKRPIAVKKIKTLGDKILDSPLAKVGGKGLFVKEIETALTDGEIDLAVHSMKDVPTELPDGLTIGAILARENPRDALISRGNLSLGGLPAGATLGTSSLRRQAQLLRFRGDFTFVDVRGNLDTRLRKMNEGQFDAIILATAGLKRMGWEEQITEVISEDTCLPAVGQGAIGIEIRAADEELVYLVSALNDSATEYEVRCERALMRGLEGGCQVPVGGLATLNDDILRIRGIVASLDGREVYSDEMVGKKSDYRSLGRDLARELLDAGAREVLAGIRAAAGESEAER